MEMKRKQGSGDLIKYFMTSKILVLGAGGMLGLNLVKRLKQASIEFITHSRNSKTDYNFELSNTKAVFDNLDEIRADIIINLAANTDVDLCENNPKLAFKDNTRSVENIVNWIKLNGQKTRLIHISTDQVYDNDNCYSSEKDINISNYYAYSKYCGELHALNVNSIVLRTNFFGESHHCSRLSLSDWIIYSLKNQQKITLFNNIYFNPISINSLVNILVEITNSNKAGLYNLGSKNGMSKAEFGIKIAKLFDLSTKNITIDTDHKSNLAAYRPKDMRMNCDKFEKSFKIKLNSLEYELDLLRSNYE